MATTKDKYYNALLDTLFKDNNLRGEPLSNENIQQAGSKVIEKTEEEFERNYNKITCDTSFQSTMLNKDVFTINDSIYYESDDHVNTISDSSKQVDARNDPIKETHIVERVCNLLVGVGSLEQDIIGMGIIGQVSTLISTNLITNVLTKYIKHLFNTNLSQLNTFQSKALMIGLQHDSVEGNRNIICTSCGSRNIRRNNIKIGTPRVNK